MYMYIYTHIRGCIYFRGDGVGFIIKGGDHKVLGCVAVCMFVSCGVDFAVVAGEARSLEFSIPRYFVRLLHP